MKKELLIFYILRTLVVGLLIFTATSIVTGDKTLFYKTFTTILIIGTGLFFIYDTFKTATKYK